MGAFYNDWSTFRMFLDPSHFGESQVPSLNPTAVSTCSESALFSWKMIKIY